MTILNGESKFWTTNLGRLLPLFTMIVAVIGVYLANDRRVAKSENDIQAVAHSVVEVNGAVKQTNDAVKQLSDQILRMDNEGTHASQRGIMKDSDRTIENTRRIDQLEILSAAMGPKVERIDTNLDWITKWIQSQNAAKNK